MVILDEKFMIPPPPYTASGLVGPPPFPGGRSHHSLATSSHLLLKIVHMTFPQTSGIDETRHERQRKALYWLSHQLRLVNRSFYIGDRTSYRADNQNLTYLLACMHVLRSTYLPAYGFLIRAPYTSDPFPLSSPTSSPPGPVETTQRETQVLDLFIALKVHEDVMMDDTEFHLEREEAFKDLFDLMQPRSRLEDLVRYYGLREGVVRTNPPGTSLSPATSMSQLRDTTSSSSSSNHRTRATRPAPLPFSMLSVSFSPRKVGLVLTTTSRKRTILEVARTRDEKLEVTAKQLIKQLKIWLRDA